MFNRTEPFAREGPRSRSQAPISSTAEEEAENAYIAVILRLKLQEKGAKDSTTVLRDRVRNHRLMARTS
jgi:hypothetical protein